MALSAARNTPQLGSGVPKRMSYPMLTSTTIYQGGLVVRDSSGYAKPGVAATSLVCVGIACETKTNSGNSGDEVIEVEQGVFKFDVNGSAFGITDVGSLCWIYDDHTVSLTSTSRSIAGTVYHVDDDGGVYVHTSLAAPIDGTTISAVATDLSDLSDRLPQSSMYHVNCVLVTAVTGAVVARFVPGFAGLIKRIQSTATVVASTTGKAATLTPSISGTAVTGGLLALSKSGNQTLGARTSGSAITAANAFTATQEISIGVVAGQADFSEGSVSVTLYLDPVNDA